MNLEQAALKEAGHGDSTNSYSRPCATVCASTCTIEMHIRASCDNTIDAICNSSVGKTHDVKWHEGHTTINSLDIDDFVLLVDVQH